MKYKLDISNLRKNKDAKILLCNFFYLTLLKIISFLFPLITLPYLTRTIGSYGLGSIAFASAIIVIVETITDWGFNYTATRDAAQVRTDIGRVSQIFSEVLFSKITLMCLCFVVLFVLTYFISSLEEHRLLVLLTFLYIPGHILFPEWFFQAMEQMKYITILNVFSKLLFTLLVFVVIKTKDDYLWQPILVSGGYFISGIIAYYVIIKKFKIKIIIPSLKNIWRRLKQSNDMFISLILPNFYTNFSTILLSTYCGSSATGIYSEGQRFFNIVDQLISVLSRTFFPFLARHREKHYIYVFISGFISILACIGLYLGAEYFVQFFLTDEFADTVQVIRILSVAPIFLFLMNTFGNNYLVVIGKDRILRNIIIGASMFGGLLTWSLTPRYGYIGAALSVTIVWGVRGVVTYYFASKIKKEIR